MRIRARSTYSSFWTRRPKDKGRLPRSTRRQRVRRSIQSGACLRVAMRDSRNHPPLVLATKGRPARIDRRVTGKNPDSTLDMHAAGSHCSISPRHGRVGSKGLVSPKERGRSCFMNPPLGEFQLALPIIRESPSIRRLCPRPALSLPVTGRSPPFHSMTIQMASSSGELLN